MPPLDDTLGTAALIPDELSQATEPARPASLKPVGPEGIRVYAHGESGAMPVRFTKPAR